MSKLNKTDIKNQIQLLCGGNVVAEPHSSELEYISNLYGIELDLAIIKAALDILIKNNAEPARQAYLKQSAEKISEQLKKAQTQITNWNVVKKLADYKTLNWEYPKYGIVDQNKLKPLPAIKAWNADKILQEKHKKLLENQEEWDKYNKTWDVPVPQKVPKPIMVPYKPFILPKKIKEPSNLLTVFVNKVSNGNVKIVIGQPYWDYRLYCNVCQMDKDVNESQVSEIEKFCEEHSHTTTVTVDISVTEISSGRKFRDD